MLFRQKPHCFTIYWRIQGNFSLSFSIYSILKTAFLQEDHLDRLENPCCAVGSPGHEDFIAFPPSIDIHCLSLNTHKISIHNVTTSSSSEETEHCSVAPPPVISISSTCSSKKQLSHMFS